MKKIITSCLGLFFKALFQTYAAFMRVRNYKKEKVLFFTDSRGFLLGNFISYKNGFRNPLAQYLNTKFCVDFQINKFTHTTYFDLVKNYSDNDLDKYKYIILILGVVDFSPRDSNDAAEIRKNKTSFIKSNLSKETSYLDQNVLYEGEFTDSIINEDMQIFLKNRLSMHKEKIILVNTGIVDQDWDGNYWRKRPKNMNSFLAREREFASEMSEKVLDVSDIDPQTYTVDNIHYSKDGFKILLNKLKRFIK